MKILRLREGFTLVELMVVVAILGILSAVAIPNFKKYQAKSKTSEAKLHLSAIYTAEQAFASDYDVYATCLTSMGYNPTDEAAQRYYMTGYTSGSDATGAAIAVTNGASCPNYAAANAQFPAGKKIGNAAAIATLAGTGLPTLTASETGFRAGAAGFIVGNFATVGTCDTWSIDNLKRLIHIRPGY